MAHNSVIYETEYLFPRIDKTYKLCILIVRSVFMAVSTVNISFQDDLNKEIKKYREEKYKS